MGHSKKGWTKIGQDVCIVKQYWWFNLQSIWKGFSISLDFEEIQNLANLFFCLVIFSSLNFWVFEKIALMRLSLKSNVLETLNRVIIIFFVHHFQPKLFHVNYNGVHVLCVCSVGLLTSFWWDFKEE